MQTNNNKRHPFGPAQIRLFTYILKHPGCTMAQIREEEFTDKTGNYVWNLLSENYAFIDKRVIGGDIPHQFRMKMKEFGAVVDLVHYVKTGQLKQKLVQTTFAFDNP